MSSRIPTQRSLMPRIYPVNALLWKRKTLQKKNIAVEQVERGADDGEKTDDDIFEGWMDARDKGKAKVGETSNPEVSRAMSSDGLKDQDDDDDINIIDVEDDGGNDLGELEIYGLGNETDEDEKEDSNSDDGFNYGEDEEDVIESPEREPTPAGSPKE